MVTAVTQVIAVAWFWTLARELPHALAQLKKKKKKKKIKMNKIKRLLDLKDTRKKVLSAAVGT